MSCTGCAARELLNKSNIQSGQDALSCGKLDSYDWLSQIPNTEIGELVEVRFKNTRKDFFLNKEKFPFRRGEYVAVSAQQGHDVGVITLTGKMAEMQYRKKNPKGQVTSIIYRKATQSDIEKLNHARSTPISPPSGPAQRLFQEPPAKSKFLAVTGWTD